MEPDDGREQQGGNDRERERTRLVPAPAENPATEEGRQADSDPRSSREEVGRAEIGGEGKDRVRVPLECFCEHTQERRIVAEPREPDQRPAAGDEHEGRDGRDGCSPVTPGRNQPDEDGPQEELRREGECEDEPWEDVPIPKRPDRGESQQQRQRYVRGLDRGDHRRAEKHDPVAAPVRDTCDTQGSQGGQDHDCRDDQTACVRRHGHERHEHERHRRAGRRRRPARPSTRPPAADTESSRSAQPRPPAETTAGSRTRSRPRTPRAASPECRAAGSGAATG